MRQVVGRLHRTVYVVAVEIYPVDLEPDKVERWRRWPRNDHEVKTTHQ